MSDLWAWIVEAPVGFSILVVLVVIVGALFAVSYRACRDLERTERRARSRLERDPHHRNAE